MALSAFGTDANTSLQGLAFSKALTPANVALLQLSIKDDLNVAQPIWPGAFSLDGLLYVPNRGVLRILDGDVVATDATTGWPILVSARAVASGPWNI